jgi:uncharacterized protein (DUF779 family)
MEQRAQVERVGVTDAAADLIERLVAQHGALLFHQSGGCCDGSAPMCYPRDEFRIGQQDVFLGTIAGQPFYIGGQQYEYWSHTHLTVDITPGRGGGFSVEAPEGYRFVTVSRLFSDEEWRTLDAGGPVQRGVQH